MGVPIRFPLKTARLIIRPMQPGDAEALLAVYGDAETMQHLNSELPSNVEEAREWVQTKIDLFDQDGQLSLWTVIRAESDQIVGDVGLQHEDYGSGPVIGLGGRGNRQFWRQGLGFEAGNSARESAGPGIARQARHATGRNEHPRMAGLHDHPRRVARSDLVEPRWAMAQLGSDNSALYNQAPGLPQTLAEQRELVGVEILQSAPMTDTDNRAIRQPLAY
jgi:[ribosomal protein S5]-alanine N-acetyltransferase